MRLRLIINVLVALTMTGAPVLAQTASITGNVTDPSGAAVSGTQITVINTETQVERKAVTNESGYYTVPLLPDGTYSMAVEASGFSPVRRENLKLEVGQIVRADFVLKIGTVTEVVQVSAAAVLLESENTSMGQVIENKQIVEMPLNKRNYLELARLTTGVVPSSTLGRGSSMSGARGGMVGMGTRAWQSNIEVDGVDNSSRGTGGRLGAEAQAIQPSIDAVREFKVITNNFSAQYGYRMGPKVIVSLKSGTNDLHGTLFEFLRNDKLDGTNFFANRSGSAKPTLRQNQFGGTIGGPILRDRTFFFGSFEGTRIRLGRSFLTTVPSEAARNGDFSRERQNFNMIYDPATTTGTGAAAVRQPFPDNIVPRSRWDPVSGPLAQLYPLPNISGREFAANNYFSAPSDSDDIDQFDVKVDHNFSSADRMFVRFSVRGQDIYQPGPLPIEAGGAEITGTEYDTRSLAVNWTHSFSSTIFNDFRFGYSAPRAISSMADIEPLNEKLGIKNSPGDQLNDGLNKSFSNFDIEGYALLGGSLFTPNLNDMTNFHIANNLLIQKSSHTISTGFEYKRLDFQRIAHRFRRGQFMFRKQFTAQQPNVGASRINTGNALADMLLGQAAVTRVGSFAGEEIIVPYWGAYIQDDWKITPRLSLNMGLRWDFFQAGWVVDGNIPGDTGASVFLTEFTGVGPGDPLYETFERPKDGSDCGCEQDLNNFAPRLGIAYRLTNKTVIRAGAGIFFGEADLPQQSQVYFRQTPDFTEVVTNGTNVQPAALVRDGFPLVELPATAPVRGTNINTARRRQLAQYASQWFFDVQRELPGAVVWSVGYQGNQGTKLRQRRNINFAGPHPSIPANQRRLRPSWNEVWINDPIASSSYNSLLTKVEKRFSAGLTLLTSYTYSHTIDNAAEFNSTDSMTIANPYDLRAERSNSLLDFRHSLTSSFVYEFPFGKGKAFGTSWNAVVDGILGGWQAGGLLTLRSGSPFEVRFPGDSQNSGTINRGDRIAGGKLDDPTIDRYFDEFAFIPSAPGVFGNNGRNVLTGPGTRNFDLTVAKRFWMPGEGHYLQFRFESFNFTNTPKFGQPNGTLRSAGTAAISEADEPRRIQFGLKYVF